MAQMEDDPAVLAEYPKVPENDEKLNRDVINNVEMGDDELANEVINELGFQDGQTNSNPLLAQHPGHDEGKKKEAAPEGDAKPAADDKAAEKPKEGDDAAAAAKPAAEGGDSAAKGDGKKKSKANAPPKKPVNQYAQAWMTAAKKKTNGDKKEKKPYEEGTPKEILKSDIYRDAVGRFLPEFEHDRALEQAREKDISIDHSEVGEEKERDGYYPNELDEEM